MDCFVDRLEEDTGPNSVYGLRRTWGNGNREIFHIQIRVFI